MYVDINLSFFIIPDHISFHYYNMYLPSPSSMKIFTCGCENIHTFLLIKIIAWRINVYQHERQSKTRCLSQPTYMYVVCPFTRNERFLRCSHTTAYYRAYAMRVWTFDVWIALHGSLRDVKRRRRFMWLCHFILVYVYGYAFQVAIERSYTHNAWLILNYFVGKLSHVETWLEIITCSNKKTTQHRKSCWTRRFTLLTLEKSFKDTVKIGGSPLAHPTIIQIKPIPILETNIQPIDNISTHHFRLKTEISRYYW